MNAETPILQGARNANTGSMQATSNEAGWDRSAFQIVRLFRNRASAKMRQKKAKKVLEQVKQTYDTIAAEFSETRHKVGKDFDLFTPYVQPGQLIVDLGCGNGRLLWFLSQISKNWPQPTYHYLGIDNSEHVLKEAKKLFPDENFIKGDQLNIPIENNEVDVLFNIRAFHHLPHRSHRLMALGEMKRVLKKDGILIITVWNLWQPRYLHHILKGLLRSIITMGAYSPSDTFIPWGKKAKRYYHAFVPGELKKLIENIGFELIECFGQKNGERVPFSKSRDIVIVARKTAGSDNVPVKFST